MDLARQKVAVVGMGASGVAAARLCLKHGATVTGFDEAPIEKLTLARSLATEARFTLRAARFEAAMLAQSDLVVVSPGVPDNEAIAAAVRAGVEVIGELELASRFLSLPIALIGGTNGKSTTTALVAAILGAAGKRVFVGGNFGTPLADAPDGDYELLVVEISSFQAERVPTLHARAHALLNVTDDHLDRYPSFAAYAHAKGNPFENMTERDLAVVPHGDALCAKEAARGRARVATFSASDPSATFHVASDRIRGGGIVDLPRAALRLNGRHNLANACAAIAVAFAVAELPTSADPNAVLERAFAGFTGLGHRCALVGEIDGIRYYDDSKGTNVGAAVTALLGLEEPRAVLIAGGRDKQGAYDPLVTALRMKGRALVLIGEAADRIAEAARGAVPIERAASMDEAARIASALARPGDAVLLSPACSSFDMFANYRARGEAFVRAVGLLEGERR